MSKIKGENEFLKRINKIYNRDDGENIRKWLNSLKVYNMGPDSKVPGLLYKCTKIATETKSNEGAYYMIMKWISMNLDKFEDFDFENIPPSVVNGEEVINLFDIQTEKNGSPAKTNSQPKKKKLL